MRGERRRSCCRVARTGSVDRKAETELKKAETDLEAGGEGGEDDFNRAIHTGDQDTGDREQTLLRSTEGVTPDRPQTFEYEAHPKAVIAPFHYDEV